MGDFSKTSEKKAADRVRPFLHTSSALGLGLFVLLGCAPNSNPACGDQGCNMVGQILTNHGYQVEGVPLEIRRNTDQKLLGTTTSSRYGFFTVTGMPGEDLVSTNSEAFPEVSVCGVRGDKSVFCFSPGPLDSDLCEISPLETANPPFCGGGLVYGNNENTALGDPVGALNRDGLWVYSDRFTAIRSNNGMSNLKFRMKLRSGVDTSIFATHLVQLTNGLTGEDRGTIGLMVGAAATSCAPGYVCVDANLSLLGRIKIALRSGGDLLPLSTVFESVEIYSMTRAGKSAVVPWDRNKVMTSFFVHITP